MGAVFDIYWNCGDAGDQYLEGVLSGLDPSKESFSVLPPHFLLRIVNIIIFIAVKLHFHINLHLQWQQSELHLSNVLMISNTL